MKGEELHDTPWVSQQLALPHTPTESTAENSSRIDSDLEATQVATKGKSKRTTKKPEWTKDYVSSVYNDSYTATWVANVTNHACDCVSFSGMSQQQNRDKSRRRDQSRDTRRSSRERDDSREPRAGRDRQREQATDRPFTQPRPSLGGLGEQSRGGM